MRIVIALGGNALGNNPNEQKELVKFPAAKIAHLASLNHTVIVGHGNGPQVGMIYNAFADAKKSNDKTPIVPFAEAGGMSQGYIGYHLLTAIKSELNKLNANHIDVVYFETLTYVDKNDLAFKNPSKPVGPFYKTLTEAKQFNPNATIIEDAGRGYRVVVPSPKPVNFLGINVISNLVNQNRNVIVIVGGGGGIPIIEENNQIIGLDGVIDKDFTCAKIATLLDADTFAILTAVDYVYVNWNHANQTRLEKVNVKQLNQFIDENQFAKGSMLPKVLAAIDFVKDKPNKKAIIANLKDIELAIQQKVGTTIVSD